MEDQVIAVLRENWDINPDRSITKEQMLEALALRVSKLLTGTSESFFQAMYRLDIGEAKLANALVSMDPPTAIAQLIWDRQMQKMQSRASHTAPRDPDDELSW